MGSVGALDLQELVVDVMRPTRRKAPFSGDGWLFEPKWDGFRAICYVQEGKVRFLSRNKRSLTEKFPELQSIASEVRTVGAILDGEIVAIDDEGMPCFDRLRSRKTGSGLAVVFYGALPQKSLLPQKSVFCPKNLFGVVIPFVDHNLPAAVLGLKRRNYSG